MSGQENKGRFIILFVIRERKSVCLCVFANVGVCGVGVKERLRELVCYEICQSELSNVNGWTKIIAKQKGRKEKKERKKKIIGKLNRKM